MPQATAGGPFPLSVATVTRVCLHVSAWPDPQSLASLIMMERFRARNAVPAEPLVGRVISRR